MMQNSCLKTILRIQRPEELEAVFQSTKTSQHCLQSITPVSKVKSALAMLVSEEKKTFIPPSKNAPKTP